MTTDNVSDCSTPCQFCARQIEVGENIHRLETRIDATETRRFEVCDDCERRTDYGPATKVTTRVHACACHRAKPKHRAA